MQLAEQDQALEKTRRLGLSVLSLTQALPRSRFLNPSYILSLIRVKVLEAVGVAVGSSPGHFPLLQLVGSALPSDATAGGVQGAGSYCCFCTKRVFRNVGMTEPSMVLVSKVCCVPFLVIWPLGRKITFFLLNQVTALSGKSSVEAETSLTAWLLMMQSAGSGFKGSFAVV